VKLTESLGVRRGSVREVDVHRREVMWIDERIGALSRV
jgi:hypothetical protein